MIVIESDVLEANLELCKLVLNDIGAYVYIKGIDRKYVYANDLTEQLLKGGLGSIVGNTDEEFFDLITCDDIQESDDKVLLTGEIIKRKEVTIIKATGEKRIYLSEKKPIVDKSNKIVGMLGVSTDITDIYTLQNELEIQASTDHLTGLYNRRFFFDLAKKSFSEAQRHNNPLSLIMFDIDLFKKVNDKYGHPIGDIIIQFISSQARSLLREEDLLARVGGEEFVILLPHTDIKAAQLIAEKVRFHIDSQDVTGEWVGKIDPKISLGVSTFTDGDTEFYEMYTRSDKALYEAKYSGRNKVCVAERVDFP